MSVKIIGIVTYEINDPPQQGIDQFYLTEELLPKLEQLNLESQDLIYRSVRMESLLSGGTYLQRIGPAHIAAEGKSGG